jgi:nuclear pore complex protein Nup188
MTAAAFFHTGYEEGDPRPDVEPFARHTESIVKINDIMNWAKDQATPLSAISMYSWAIFLHQWSAAQDPAAMEQLEFLNPSNLESLAAQAVDGRGFFTLLQQFMEVLRTAYRESFQADLENMLRDLALGLLWYSVDAEIIQYGADLVQSLLAILDADRSYWEPPSSRIMGDTRPLQLIETYLSPILGQAMSRFPIEGLPFMKLMRALFMLGPRKSVCSEELLSILCRSTEFTDVLKEDFRNYDQVDEDLTADQFQIYLTADLPIFLSHSAASGRIANSSTELVPFGASDWTPTRMIPRDTRGEVRQERKPLVITWAYEYSPLAYLMDCLSTTVPGSKHVRYSGDDVSRDDMVEIIRLLAAALSSLHNNHDNSADSDALAQDILQHRFALLDTEKDLITVVFDIFEFELQRSGDAEGAEVSAELLAACVEFLHSMLFFSPSRIWPLLLRSQLLDINGSSPRLVAVVTNFEIVSGSYSFLQSCVCLFDTLIDLAVSPQPAKNQNSKKALTRFGQAATGPSFAVPKKTIRAVITGFSNILRSVFEDCQFWRYTNPRDRLHLTTALMKAFDKLILVAYGYDEEPDLSKKFTAVLSEAAETTVDRFLTPVSTKSLATPMTSILSKPLLPPVFGNEREHRDSVAEVESALQLSTRLLHIATYLNASDSALERHLFRLAPALARLFAASKHLQSPVSTLMDALLRASLRHDGAPSLLGHMGADNAKCFLILLTQVNQPLQDSARDLSIWRLLSTVVSAQQKWFALYLLTGKTPRHKASETDKNEYAGQSVLKHALDQLSSLPEHGTGTDSDLVYEKMLTFVTLSYNHWPWAIMGKIREHPFFMKNITDYFAALRRDGRSVQDLAFGTAVAASIAEVLTLHLHTLRQLGDYKTALTLVNKLGYVKNYGFKMPEYKTTATSLLRQNIAELYPGLKLSMFKHSQAFPVDYGDNFLYDTPLALRMMRLARQSSRHRNFISDFQTANIDLSQVDAQMHVQSSCKLLAIELSEVVAKDPELRLVDPLVEFITDALENSDKRYLPFLAEAFQRSQFEVALVLMQKVVAIDMVAATRELVRLFPVVWQAICNHIPDFDQLYSSQDAEIYKQLLRLLFLAIQPLTRADPEANNLRVSQTSTLRNRSPKESRELLEILSDVVLKGFKTLAIRVHDDIASCEPSDFALLTAIFQSILKVPGIEHAHAQIAAAVAESGVIRFASSLFSWSDRLLLNGNDPVYGEHSILFLHELSTVPAVAEALAVSGILSQLSAANLLAPLTRSLSGGKGGGGVGPFDRPPRLHAVWTRGVLPLCLNVLAAVGPPIEPELRAFLAMYAPQPARLLRDLANRGGRVPAAGSADGGSQAAASPRAGTRPNDAHMTLGIAAEAHAMALLSRVLDGPAAAASAPGATPTAASAGPAADATPGASSGAPANAASSSPANPTDDPAAASSPSKASSARPADAETSPGRKGPAPVWDAAAARDELDEWLHAPAAAARLRALLVPATEREAEMAAARARDARRFESRLEERVWAELRGALECLGGGGSRGGTPARR